MKNCFEFSLLSLTKYVTMMGLLEVLDILNHFEVATGIFTLDVHCLQTEELEKMRHLATKSQFGFSLMAPSRAVEYFVQLITNPVSPEEAYKINTALKTLDLKKNGNTQQFYALMGEAMARRLIFTKLSQIYCPLIEEYKSNKKLLIMLTNNKLLDLNHIQELNVDQMKLAHYTIHNVNSRIKLQRFSQIISRWCRDTNLIELVFEINFELACYQMAKLDERITEDAKKNACLIY